MRFDFRPELIKPTVPILLRLTPSSAPVEADALVDTGADICVFDSEWLEALGVQFGTGVEGSYSGPNGHTAGDIWPAYFEVIGLGRGPVRFDVLWVEGLADQIKVPGILGCSGFLDQFVVRVDVKSRYLELT